MTQTKAYLTNLTSLYSVIKNSHTVIYKKRLAILLDYSISEFLAGWHGNFDFSKLEYTYIYIYYDEAIHQRNCKLYICAYTPGTKFGKNMLIQDYR